MTGQSGMGDMMGGSGSSLNGDVTYPLHVINGRGPVERETVLAKPGQRVRLRLINAGSDTPYRVAITDHRMTVTHADGFPVKPIEVDTVLMGMGERYDIIVTVKSGAFAIVAVAEGNRPRRRSGTTHHHRCTITQDRHPPFRPHRPTIDLRRLDTNRRCTTHEPQTNPHGPDPVKGQHDRIYPRHQRTFVPRQRTDRHQPG